MSLRPASRACRSASSNAAAHASSSSLIFARRWYHERRIVPPHPRYGTIGMRPSYRVIKRLLTVIPAIGLFLLLHANPFAQSPKLPAPTSQINDLAGVLDAETKGRLENVLQRLKEKSNLELYVVTVENTGTQEIS